LACRLLIFKPMKLLDENMLDHNSQHESVYQADAAYQLRDFVKTKRYQMSEITATTVNMGDPARAEVEAFIHAVFKHAYGAEITEFMPHLVALRDNNGVLMAAFGLKKAIDGSLFLEQYLDEPIESLISKRLNKKITRDQITKIGNLAVANPRNAGVLIAHVIQYSLDMGVEWCVATAHHSLQNGLIKGGRDVYPLFPADKARLSPEEQARWGSYYKNMPQVVAIRGIAE
jgi:Thermostable hemolysin